MKKRRWARALALAIFLSATQAEAAQVVISWQDNSGNEDGFNVQRRLQTDPDTAYKQVLSAGPNINTVIDTTVVAGQIYCYRVNAFNKAGTSPWSAEACLLATPTGVVLTYTP